LKTVNVVAEFLEIYLQQVIDSIYYAAEAEEGSSGCLNVNKISADCNSMNLFN